MNNNEYPKEQEKMTKQDRAMLIRAMGFGASVIIDFNKLDFERGSMHTGPRERVFWTTDGNKVTFSMTTDGGVIGTQSKKPDPDLPEIAFPGYQGD